MSSDEKLQTMLSLSRMPSEHIFAGLFASNQKASSDIPQTVSSVIEKVSCNEHLGITCIPSKFMEIHFCLPEFHLGLPELHLAVKVQLNS